MPVLSSASPSVPSVRFRLLETHAIGIVGYQANKRNPEVAIRKTIVRLTEPIAKMVDFRFIVNSGNRC